MKSLPLTIASIRSDPGGLMVVRPIYQTNDPAAYETALTAASEAVKGSKGLRPATKGNRRPVKVWAVDLDEAAKLIGRGTIEKGFPIGHTFPTVQDASAGLGLSLSSLRQLFCAARKANGGNAAPVTVRGHSLEYADTRDTVSE